MPNQFARALDRLYTQCISKGVNMRTKIVKWGNSLGLRIPKSFADQIQVTDGSAVDLNLENGRIVIRPAPPKGYSLDELLGGVTDENLHAEVDPGKPIGREQW